MGINLKKNLQIRLFIGSIFLIITSIGAMAQFPEIFRTINGTTNNADNSDWGSVGSQLFRYAKSDYYDGISVPWVDGLPSARQISNIVVAQEELVTNRRRVSDIFWLWGQFLDHDIDLTESADPAEPFNIPVPAGDPFFDPDNNGTKVIPLLRSIYNSSTGTDQQNPRQQINEITSFIDASNVYGSDAERAEALRANDGSGCLKTGNDNLLPYNTEGLPNANTGLPASELYLAGDVRANEQVALTAIHTLFMREHNRLCKKIKEEEPDLTGDEIYERVRAIVGAQMQVITYKEFLPLLLGRNALGRYRGYDPNVNPGIRNIFSTAAFRLGHSMLSPELLRLTKKGRVHSCGHLPLREAFFAPKEISECGIEPLFRGLASQIAQEIDVHVIDDVRNFLFGDPGDGGFDLASLNIQRGRDHGLPSYNQARQDLGLSPATSFADITSDEKVQEALATAYDNDVNKVDVWVGGLAEDHVRGAMVGELFFNILKNQFEALRDGDRFWYQNVFSGNELRELERTKLADIIRRNTEIDTEIVSNVFLGKRRHSPGPSQRKKRREDLRGHFR